jgi:hypothetical protein
MIHTLAFLYFVMTEYIAKGDHHFHNLSHPSTGGVQVKRERYEHIDLRKWPIFPVNFNTSIY